MILESAQETINLLLLYRLKPKWSRINF